MHGLFVNEEREKKVYDAHLNRTCGYIVFAWFVASKKKTS